MKKILPLIAALFIITAIQAQDKIQKNTYVKNGDLIEATLYHDNGIISQKGFFTENGDLTGLWMSYDREGNKTAKAFYDKGAKVGTWFFWKGNTLTEVSYENSRIAAVSTWENTGSRVVSNK